jgi:hypothetical protein
MVHWRYPNPRLSEHETPEVDLDNFLEFYTIEQSLVLKRIPWVVVFDTCQAHGEVQPSTAGRG